MAVVSAQETSNPFAIGVADMVCPLGALPVAVGFAGFELPLTFRASLFDPPDRWGGVTVRNHESSAATFTGYGLCLAKSACELTYAEHDGTVPPGSARGIGKGCPAGTKLVAGAGGIALAECGALAALVPRNYPRHDSHLPVPAWTVLVDNTTGAKSALVKAVATCATDPALRVRVVPATGVPASPGSTTTNVRCPLGTEVAGGGWSVPSSSALFVVAGRPVVTRSTATPESWTVRVTNNRPTTGRFNAYAVCVSLA